tara:strand:- start:9813 stop:12392 length:2580 start_codon:yes stop_codon:yes gene_type:complete
MHQSRVFYTTPLKALSNQKFRDFSLQFGQNKVGLLTGDITINRDAPILVMTTEILRNMLYGEFEEEDDPLIDLESVILDECHYMNDPQRGTVWEETIIHCPSRTQIIALSATIANSEQLKNWINKVHGPTTLVRSDYRPVPLDFIFCSSKGLHPLLNKKKTGIHPNCKVWRSPKGQKRKGQVGRLMQPKAPPITFVISKLFDQNMLPAIYFIFSRKGCDRALENINHLTLVNYHEANLISQEIKLYIKNNQEGIKDKLHFDALKKGIASHHAGLLPAWKELVERLFQRGLIKVVFATETLAAGINMPARTTVISSLSKRTDEGHRLLLSSEFLQMSGRAGRRGKDTKGFVVTVQNRFEGAKEASIIALSKPNPLNSQFAPSYGMVLNLLQNFNLSKSKELIKRSFGSFINIEESNEEINNLKVLENELTNLKDITQNISWQDFDKYEKLKNRMKEERRLLKILEKQASKKLLDEISSAIKFLKEGTFISIKAPQIKSKIMPAVICKKIFDLNKNLNLVCLTSENSFILLKPSFVINIFPDLETINLTNLIQPELHFTGEISRGNDLSAYYSDLIIEKAKVHDLITPQYDLAKEVVSQNKLISKIEKEIIKNPADKCGDYKKLRKYRSKISQIENSLNEKKKILVDKENYNWNKFKDLVKILNYFGCLDDVEITDIGKSISTLRTENELWVGLVLLSGYLDDLEPPDLAAVIQSISIEKRRPDSWCNFKPSLKVIDTLNEIEGLKNLISKKQNHFSIDFPLNLEKDLTGIVSDWAKGKKWRELIFNTSLDEGDVVRIIRRTIDLLSQIQYCLGASKRLKRNAKLALKAINRFPVSESKDLLNISKNAEINPATKRLDNQN